MSGERRDTKRGIERLVEQAEKLFGAGPADTQPEDRIERLGKLIGRGLAWLIAIGLAIYLWQTYFAR